VLEDPIDETGEYSIAVSGSGGVARFTVERHPFDVVGWDGAIYPFALNLADVEPIEGRYHVTPDQSELFSAASNAICGNVPHRRESDPSSMPAPPHHDNVDYDEIVIVVPQPGADNSRNPRAGMLWVHGRTFPHGGPPGFEEYQLPDVIEDYAYMIDTVAPMKLTTIAKDVDVSDYTTTFWRG
jgi:homogentisate 1,2-dioxygenase